MLDPTKLIKASRGSYHWSPSSRPSLLLEGLRVIFILPPALSVAGPLAQPYHALACSTFYPISLILLLQSLIDLILLLQPHIHIRFRAGVN